MPSVRYVEKKYLNDPSFLRHQVSVEGRKPAYTMRLDDKILVKIEVEIYQDTMDLKVWPEYYNASDVWEVEEPTTFTLSSFCESGAVEE